MFAYQRCRQIRYWLKLESGPSQSRSKQGLKDIGVQSTRQEQTGDNNIWTRVGFSVPLKYDNEARNTTCHIIAIDSL